MALKDVRGHQHHGAPPVRLDHLERKVILRAHRRSARRTGLRHLHHLIAQVEVEEARIGHQVDEAAIHQREELQECEERFENFLTVRPRVFDGAELLRDRAGMDEGVLDNHLAEVGSHSHVVAVDRLRVDEAGVD
ncbi:hypothetical protein D9M72_588940 [compost metagenome]